MIAHMVHIYFLLCQLTHLIRVEMIYCHSKIELNIVDSNCSSNNVKCNAIKMHIFQLALKSPLICFLNLQAGAQGTFSGPQVYSILSLPPWRDQGSSGRQTVVCFVRQRTQHSLPVFTLKYFLYPVKARSGEVPFEKLLQRPELDPWGDSLEAQRGVQWRRHVCEEVLV